MIRMLVTINISKGWKTWSEMAKGLEPYSIDSPTLKTNSLILASLKP